MKQRPPQSTPGSCWRRGRWLTLFATCALALGCEETGKPPPVPSRSRGIGSQDVPLESPIPSRDGTNKLSSTPSDPRTRIEVLQLSAKAGNYKDQFELGMRYLEGRDVPQNDFFARKWLTESAEQGYAPAQYQLGLRCANTSSIIHDGATAVKWLKRAALQNQDVANAEFQVGRLYLQGRVPEEGRDFKKAEDWFRRAAGKEHAAAMLELGLMHANGLGMPRNLPDAAKFYELAALRGNTIAQRLIGEAHYNGIGVPRDSRAAAPWFEKASASGDQRAMLGFARLLTDGDGVGKDLVEAYILYRLVAANPDPKVIDVKTALKNVSNLEQALKPEELEKSQRRVNEMLKSSGQPLAGPRI